MIERERYYTEPLLNENANVKGIAAVVKIIRRTPSVKRIVLITTLLHNTQFLKTFFNYSAAPKQFAKGPVLFPETTINSIHSSMDKHASVEDEIIVTLGLNSDDLLKFEDNIDSKYIVAVPWLEYDVIKWSKITGALEYPSLELAVPYNEPTCILKEALDDMRSINWGSVPFHDSDHDRIKTYFKALNENGIMLDEEIIESYLFKFHNWSKLAIDKSLIILSAIKEGRKIKGKVGDIKYFIKKWQNACP